MVVYNVKIRETIQVTNNRIVLHKGYGLDKTTELKPWENIVCYDSSDNVVWKINGALKYWDKEADSFVKISFIDGILRAVSFSGNTYIVNLDTGVATWDQFSK